ncbi:MAG: hypothetical protein JWQ50_9000 [Caballeronia mineralivorans]|jgi:hypothetical protein|nr:hypothetical protein [Caballeronia mineralivorans]MEA3095850.1 hypothetical protein [Caballeronia mineralivorans]
MGPDCISDATGQQYPTYRFNVAEVVEETVAPALLRASPAPVRNGAGKQGASANTYPAGHAVSRLKPG